MRTFVTLALIQTPAVETSVPVKTMPFGEAFIAALFIVVPAVLAGALGHWWFTKKAQQQTDSDQTVPTQPHREGTGSCRGGCACKRDDIENEPVEIDLSNLPTQEVESDQNDTGFRVLTAQNVDGYVRITTVPTSPCGAEELEEVARRHDRNYMNNSYPKYSDDFTEVGKKARKGRQVEFLQKHLSLVKELLLTHSNMEAMGSVFNVHWTAIARVLDRNSLPQPSKVHAYRQTYPSAIITDSVLTAIYKARSKPRRPAYLIRKSSQPVNTRAELADMLKEGLSIREIAARRKVGTRNIYYQLRRYRLPTSSMVRLLTDEPEGGDK